jgi:predicted CoA-binding protein
LDLVIPSDEELKEIYATTKTIAVVGASSDPMKAGHRIPAYLQSQGFRIIPVSPKGGELFGREVVESLADIDEQMDVVDVFRPSEEAPDIAKQAAGIGAKVLWLQTGIRSEEAADVAERAGMRIVQDVCMGETHARLALGPGPD